MPDYAEEPTQILLPGRRSLLVRLSANEGMRPALLDVLNTYADGLGEEPGTEVFMISIDPDDANLVWLFEVFKDEDAEEAHRRSSGFVTMMNSMPPLVAAPPAVLRTTPLRMTLHEDSLAEDWAL